MEEAHNTSSETSTMSFTVTVSQTGEAYSCSDHDSLLQGMSKLGRKGIPVGCLNGGCGVCKIRITKGSVKETGPISRAHVSLGESSAGVTLACRVAPQSDIELEVVGKMQKSFLARFASTAAS